MNTVKYLTTDNDYSPTITNKLLSKVEKDIYEESLGGDGRTILEWNLNRYCVRNWINLTQNRDYWKVLVNVTWNLQVS